jgi:glycosyltransferase involved in cell wall biosynthesis
LVIEGLRSHGNDVRVVDPRELENSERQGKAGRFDAIVGDSLWVREIGRGFERVARPTARVLLVHHLASWEVEIADQGAMRAIEARAVAVSDHLVATGHATASRLTVEYPGRTIDVVVPGADRLPRVPRFLRRQGVVEMVFVGSLIPRKRLPMLLDAMERLADPRLALTVVGDRRRDPNHAREIAARIDASAVLRACVTTVGLLEDDGIAHTMARADALVLPSSLEGYGMVIAEALHAGLAVFMARETARAAGLGDEPAAVVFDDVHGLTEGIRRFVEDPSRRAAMQRAAGRSKPPRWTEAVASFQDVLTRVVTAQAAREPYRGHVP